VPTATASAQSVPLLGTVAGHPASARHALPFTGVDIGIWLLIGFAMLLLGAGLRVGITRSGDRDA
jgi:hypothetical protein